MEIEPGNHLRAGEVYAGNNIAYDKISSAHYLWKSRNFSLQLKLDNEKETEIDILLTSAVEIQFSVISALTQPHSGGYFGCNVALIKHTSQFCF